MIPPEIANCLAFVGFAASIFLTTTSWGTRQKAERK